MAMHLATTDATTLPPPGGGGDVVGDFGGAAAELAAGLLAPTPWISPKYLYDTLGCRLFELITLLPEYYPTRVESALLERHADDMARAAGRCAALVDLGAGSCAKARVLLPQLAPRDYVAVDVSAEFVRQALVAMRSEFPDVRMTAVGADIAHDFSLPANVATSHRLFFYPGSSIGNFEPAAAFDLLTRIRRMSTCGALLIGIDLIKDVAVLDAAYDDALGATAAFNRNVLNHVNALLGSNFDPRRWRHRAFFNGERSRMEMHLEALTDIDVVWPGGRRRFAVGERIHTESSHKYRRADFEKLLQRAGFSSVQTWTDASEWFAVCLARA
jgi:dimethylhistidine N-methyltransferase